ncbi:MAG: ABC transporter ATP-binding protein [Clostridiales bacterium]|nr:ABC transporter ATP-binding protein [Clostridiales bacterium]
MIKLENITKIYSNNNEQKALDDVSLQINDGEFVAIMGESGSGKSTLINIIGMMDKETAGTYLLDDVNISELNLSQREKKRRENISFIFQQFALVKRYTIYENVELPLIAKGVPSKKRKVKIMEALKALGIEDIANKYAMNTSGGQQQRAAIARAIVSDSKYILADEPTGALDSNNGEEVMKLLEDLNKSGKTVIMVTHNENLAKKAGRIINISDGKLRF